ncbi:hypothetical protein HDU76_004935 [Blyttiomyces sp. JEL0837]|nr:hypothetical protein HDU76_004935 [Blyttiomyces sp. JEL0837]
MKLLKYIEEKTLQREKGADEVNLTLNVEAVKRLVKEVRYQRGSVMVHQVTGALGDLEWKEIAESLE